jgi:hypothetical protein
MNRMEWSGMGPGIEMSGHDGHGRDVVGGLGIVVINISGSHGVAVENQHARARLEFGKAPGQRVLITAITSASLSSIYLTWLFCQLFYNFSASMPALASIGFARPAACLRVESCMLRIIKRC